MKKEIKFDTGAGKNPVLPEKSSTPSEGAAGGFRSLLFRDELYKKKKKFEPGDFWLRFLPSIEGSKFPWMMRLEVYSDIGGVTFVSPSTFDDRATNPIRIAQDWLRKNKPELLRKRDVNPDGFKLWPGPYGVSWVIDDTAEEGSRLGLYCASLYDGSRGGTTGAAHRIKAAAEERDTEPGSPTLGELVHGDVTDPESGRLVKLTVAKPKGTEFASYAVAIGKKVVPLSTSLDTLTEEEHNLLAPLEKVIYVPTSEEIHGFLKAYIGEALHNEIFG